MNLVIDADGLLYRSGFAAEKHTYVVEGNIFETKGKAEDFRRTFEIEEPAVKIVEAEPVENVLHTLKLQINSIKTAVQDQYGSLGKVLVVLSGPENYRYDIATIRPYKGNRDPEHKPIYMQQMKDYLVSRFGAIYSDGVEADDVVAQLGTANRGRLVMASMDKDLWQVPGLHYDFLHEKHFDIDDETGLCNLYTQIISGDATDNILGCYKVGKKGAEALVYNIRNTPWSDLQHLEMRLYAAALNCYEQSLEKFPESPYGQLGMTAREALAETAQLVYLLRSKNDHWRPPTGLEFAA